MENLFMFLATSLVLRISLPKRKRCSIGKSGASCLLFTADQTFSVKNTPEGDCVYFNDHTENGVTYGVICIEMKKGYAMPQAQTILLEYMDRMQKPLSISHRVAVELKRKFRLLSATDYWQDEAGLDWKIQGYTNGKIIAVLYVKNIAAAAVKEQEGFLESFRFS